MVDASPLGKHLPEQPLVALPPLAKQQDAPAPREKEATADGQSEPTLRKQPLDACPETEK